MIDTIPGYQINELLAEGGMAKVYLATQTSLERQVALKVLNDGQPSHFSQRFINEGKTIASLSHPNIIVIYDIGIAQGQHYISMEYIKGGSLEDKIKQRLPINYALTIFKQLLPCLSYIHKQGIVHRDIKPANILFKDPNTPLLTDFGISKQRDIDAKLTQDGTLIGSPYYLSPEQARGQELDHRSDLYSLGVILYEMLTGEKPFEGPSYVDTIVMHLQSSIPRLPKHISYLQPLLDQLLAKDKRERFASASAILKALEQLEKQKPSNFFYQLLGQHYQPTKAYLKKELSIKYTVVVLCIVLSTIALYLITHQLIRYYNKPDLIAPLENTVPTKVVNTQDDEPQNVQPTPANEEEVLPAEPSPEELAQQAKNAQIEYLLQQGRSAYQADRLTVPNNNNALYFFQQVLLLDPNNVEAIKGIQLISDRFVRLIEIQIAQVDYPKGISYYNRLKAINPNHPKLPSLHQRLESIDSVPERVWKRLLNLK